MNISRLLMQAIQFTYSEDGLLIHPLFPIKFGNWNFKTFIIKSLLRHIVCILFTGIIFLSCKKVRSCEGCKEGNKPPIAVAGPDQVITLPADIVSLDGNCSWGPDGTIINWFWTKISGPASFNIILPSKAASVVKNLVADSYPFELRVTVKS